MFGIIDFLFKTVFNLFKFIFNVISNIFGGLYEKISFVFDMMNEDRKTENKIKKFYNKHKKMNKINNEM